MPNTTTTPERFEAYHEANHYWFLPDDLDLFSRIHDVPLTASYVWFYQNDYLMAWRVAA